MVDAMLWERGHRAAGASVWSQASLHTGLFALDADAKVCSSLATGRCAAAVGHSCTWERTGRFSSGLPVGL